MTIPSTASGRRLDGMMRFWTKGSRIVLLLTGVLVLVMPITEYFWNFDHFLRGGQDIELGLFSLLMVTCLILVMLRHIDEGMTFVLAICDRLFLVPRDRTASDVNLFVEQALDLQKSEFPAPAISRYTLPILV
jgi:hypothetical protein